MDMYFTFCEKAEDGKVFYQDQERAGREPGLSNSRKNRALIEGHGFSLEKKFENKRKFLTYIEQYD